METEYLNFRDEERFSGYDLLGYQGSSSMLEWSTITGIKHEYPYLHSPRDSMDDSGAYWDDEEQELNGDIAVIPVSGRLDGVFPHLSSSPDCKEDFQKMLSDWHEHIGALEGSDTEDHISLENNHTSDLSISNIDYDPTPKIHNSSPDRQSALDTEVLSTIPVKIKEEQDTVDESSPQFAPDSFHSPFSIANDANLGPSLSDMELNLGDSPLKQFDIDHIVKHENEILLNPKNENNLLDNSNFDLITAVVKDEIDLDFSIDSDKTHHSPDFDIPLKDNFHIPLKDSFDLTSYINGDEEHALLESIKPKDQETPKRSRVRKEKKQKKVRKSKSKPNRSKPPIENKHDQTPLKVDVEEDCIDVETVSPTGIHPVIEAGDLTTLLEQFEATEAVNTSKGKNELVESKTDKPKKGPLIDNHKTTHLSQKSANKRPKKVHSDGRESVPKHVIDRIKASGKKRAITVIPAMPAKKSSKSSRSLDGGATNRHSWTRYSGEKSVQLDHNYCTVSPTKSSKILNHLNGSSESKKVESVTEYYKVLKKTDSVGRGIGSKGIRCVNIQDLQKCTLELSSDTSETETSTIEINTENKELKTIVISKKSPRVIDDTAIRIQKAKQDSPVRSEVIIRKQISPNKIMKASPSTPTKIKILPQSRTIISQNSLIKNVSRMQQSLLTVNQKSVLMKSTNSAHSLLKSNLSNANFKNADGKVMVSVLKTNNKNLNSINQNKIIVNTVVNTTTPNDECIQNIIIDDTQPLESNCPKKRKLNLEEYKKRREISRTHSCNTSRTNSPLGFIQNGNSSPMVHHGSFSLPVTAIGSPASQPGTPVYDAVEPIKKIEPKKLSPEEKLLKMAADILTTPAKSSNNGEVKYTIEPFTEPKSENEKPAEIVENVKEPEVVYTPPKPINEDIEMLTIVSVGINTDESYIAGNKSDDSKDLKGHDNVSTRVKTSFKIKKTEILVRNKVFDIRSSESEEYLSPEKKTKSKPVNTNIQESKISTIQKAIPNSKQAAVVDKDKLTEIIKPILQSANTKINSNSLISNITATILKKKPESVLSSKNVTQKSNTVKQDSAKSKPVEIEQAPPEHGEDKTVIILDKKREKPKMCDIEIQTEPIIEEIKEKEIEKRVEEPEITEISDKRCRQYRSRRVSTSSSSSSVSHRSLRISRKNCRSPSLSRSRRHSHRTSSTRSSHRRSVSSLGSSRWSRSSQSRSRSRSRSYLRSYSRSSYSSISSRSRSRSQSSSRRRRLDSRRSSSSRYSRTRRRSRSSYRSYRRSRSPYNRGPRGRTGRSWESIEREKLRQVEERRVIYVGRLEPGMTKTDLKRLFQKFGPIIEVSVHFRDQGDNYGFVTFSYQEDAYEAIEQGSADPDLVHYEISFGGRRAFCKTRYSDLDNSDAIEMNNYRPAQEDSSFDMLLKEAQAKLRKRKV